MKWITPVALLVCTVLSSVASVAMAAAGLETQRRDFLAARAALNQGDRARYEQLARGLRDYPLYVYLEYDALLPRVDSAAADTVRGFLQRYGEGPLADRVRSRWLTRLARERAWSDFLADYRATDDASLRCYHAQALLETGERDAGLAEAQALWLVGRSQPPACDSVFARLEASSLMNRELILDRIHLAMEEGQLQLAGVLARRLDSSAQDWVSAWQRMYQEPARELQSARYQRGSDWTRVIVMTGLRRLAKTAPDLAMQRWQAMKSGQGLPAVEAAALERDLAAAAGRKQLAQAIGWLDGVDAAVMDDEFHQLRVRTAVLRGDWDAVRRWVPAMSAGARDEMANYWLGQAATAAGDKATATAAFRAAAQERSYYGFLAADRLGELYNFNHQPIAADDQALAALAARPAVRRAEELFRLRLITEARREWRELTRDLPVGELKLAAVIAHRWGWHERAIATLGQAKAYDDLEVRFPVLYREHITSQARRQALDPSWMYGVMRQESAFMVDARSSAGALGLMQLMPATAKYTAKLLKLPHRGDSALLQPDYNIQLGSAYLRYVLDKFGGNPVLATAAYNAGPGRVRQWRPSGSAQPVDQWVEAIPFNETRKYVQNVMSYSVLFDYRLEQPIKTLSQRMPAKVGPVP